MIITHSKNYINKINRKLQTFGNRYFIDESLYNHCIQQIDIRQIRCPNCCVYGFVYHGSYKRTFSNSLDEIIDIRVCRILCSSCHHSHALLLSPMVPYSRFSLFLTNLLERVPLYQKYYNTFPKLLKTKRYHLIYVVRGMFQSFIPT